MAESIVDFAKRIGELIKGRSPVGHTHDERYARATLPDIPTSVANILTMADGDYGERFGVNATVERGYPPAPGNIAGWFQLRSSSSGGMRWAAYRPYNTPGATWENRYVNGSWVGWKLVSDPVAVQQAVTARDEAQGFSTAAQTAAQTATNSSATAVQAADYAATVAYDQPLAVTDATTALIAGDKASATRAALDKGYRTVINVMDFGAVGSSTADDTAAIQAAEAAAAAGRGAALFFPAGTYKFSHTITATAILGHNRQKTILHYTGTGDAVGNGGGLKYHRKFESFTLRGENAGTGLNLDTSPAGSYRNMIVQNFETGIYLNGGSTLYNVFDDVTVASTVTGVRIDGLAHESRFKNFRINFAQIGVEVLGAGRTVIDSSSVENCTQYGVVIRDRGPGRNVATTMIATRFEFNPVNIRVEPNVPKTAIIACHPVGGITEDLGIDTLQINTNGTITTSGTVTAGTVKGENVEAVALKGDRAQARTSFNDARIQLIESGTVIDRNRDGAGTALRVNQVHETSTGSVLDVQRRSTTVARVTNSGHLGIRAASAPTAASVVTGEAQFWVDTTTGAARLMVTAKQADGKVVTGSIPLTVTTS